MKHPVYLTKYVVGVSDSVPKRDVRKYIHGRCYPFLGDDYYYCYVYEKGVVRFVAGMSDSYVQGRVPVVAPVLFQRQGSFYVRDSKRDCYHVFVCSSDRIDHFISNNPPDGATLLDEQMLEKYDRLPELRWSLSRVYHNKYVLAFLLISLCFWLFAMHGSLRAVSEYAGTVQKQQTKETMDSRKNRNVNLSELMDRITSTAKSGRIDRIEIRGGKATVSLFFRTEEDCYSFISSHGGKYEGNNKVVYTVSVNN